MTARLSYLSCEISVGAAALCIPRLGDSIVGARFYCMRARANTPFRRAQCYYWLYETHETPFGDLLCSPFARRTDDSCTTSLLKLLPLDSSSLL